MITTPGPRVPLATTPHESMRDVLRHSLDVLDSVSSRQAEPLGSRDLRLHLHELLQVIDRVEMASGAEIETLLGKIAELYEAGPGRPPAADLTPDQTAALQKAGSLVDEIVPVEERASVLSAARTDVLIEDALTTREVATMLGVSESRVRQRALARSLLSTKNASGLHFYRFQFEDQHELPGWEVVAPAFPVDAHPLSMQHVLDAPRDELAVGADEVSVRQWLKAGGAAGIAADAVAVAYLLP